MITSLLTAWQSVLAQQWEQLEFPAQLNLTEKAPYSGRELPRVVAGSWVRARATFSDPIVENRVTVAAYAKGRRITFSLPTSCDAEARCETLAWIPAEAERTTVGFWTASGSSQVSHVKVDRSRAGLQRAEVLAQLDGMLSQVEANYYRSSEVDWPSVASAARAATSSAPDDVEPVPAILVHVLANLPGSQHSRVMPRLTTAPHVDATTNDTLPSCTFVSANIHALTLPSAIGLDPEQATRYVERAHSCILAQPSGTTWILDLRKSFGGHSEVMISAVAPLLRGGRLFDWINGQGKRLPVTLQRDGVRTNGHLTRNRKLPLALRADARAVAWIGPGCASACEVLALVLTERPDTLVLGAPTQGVATGNEVIQIDDKFEMALTAGRMVNARGQIVGDRIEPHETAGLDEIAALVARIERGW